MEVITTHTNADFDTLASMLAAKKLYPDAHLVFPGSQERGVRDFLLKSTIYAFKLERIKDVDIDRIDRLILVDIRQASRIGRFAEIIDKPGIEIHIYDHHPSTPEDIHGDVEHTMPYGSTTTILTHIIKEKGIELTPEEATIMLLGIYEDTGSLIYPSTTIKDFEAAAFLVSKGGDLKVVSDMLTKELTIEEFNLLNEMINSITTYKIEGIDVVITQLIIEHHIGDVAFLVHKLRDILNMDVLFSLIMMEDRIHLIARSRRTEVDVGEIAKLFGGGGHPTAASATIKDMTLIEAKDRLLSILREKIPPKKRIGDLISSPPITVKHTNSIKEAGEILTKYNINAIPVIRGEKVLGIITRQVVEKALFHGLEDLKVSEYMTTDFMTVDKDTPLSAVRDVIIENNQRILPVMDGERFVGVITRTDLLRLLQIEAVREAPESGDLRESVSVRKKYIKKLMEERLPERVIEVLRDAGSVAEELGFRAYVVGGFVRDLLLGNENLDIDIVIEGDGTVFARHFSHRFDCRSRSHKRFKTAVIIFPDGFKIDVATARLEYYEKPGAMPTIEKSSIKLDLYRRDFTINTLAISLNPQNFGELLDFYGGLKDLKSRTIRVLHNLSFVEDPTRIFRAIRFEQRFGFSLGKHTMKLIKNASKIDVFQSLSRNRFFLELIAILKEDVSIEILKRLGELGLLTVIHPDISFDTTTEELLHRTRDVLSWFRLLYREEEAEEWLVIYLSLTSRLEQDELVRLSKGFGIAGKHPWAVIGMRERSLEVINKLYRKGLKPSDIYHILRTFHLENLLFMMALSDKETVRRRISLYVTRLKDYTPHLSGDDLKRIGIPEGPVCGEALRMLLDKGLNGELKSREDEVKYVRHLMKTKVSVKPKGSISL